MGSAQNTKYVWVLLQWCDALDLHEALGCALTTYFRADKYCFTCPLYAVGDQVQLASASCHLARGVNNQLTQIFFDVSPSSPPFIAEQTLQLLVRSPFDIVTPHTQASGPMSDHNAYAAMKEPHAGSVPLKSRPWYSRFSRRSIIIAGVAAALVIIGLAIGLGVGLGLHHGSDNNEPESTPTSTPRRIRTRAASSRTDNCRRATPCVSKSSSTPSASLSTSHAGRGRWR